MNEEIKRESYELIVMKLKKLCIESKKNIDMACEEQALNESINDINDTISDHRKELSCLEIELSKKKNDLYFLGVLIDSFNNVYCNGFNKLKNMLIDEDYDFKKEFLNGDYDDLNEIFTEVLEFIEEAEDELDSFIQHELGLGGIHEYFGDVNFKEEYGYIELAKNECPLRKEISNLNEEISSIEYQIEKLQNRIIEIESEQEA